MSQYNLGNNGGYGVRSVGYNAQNITYQNISTTYNPSGYSNDFPDIGVFLCRGTCGTQKGCTCGRTK
jgi:hypothetical protein